jgi:hypothetical protein
MRCRLAIPALAALALAACGSGAPEPEPVETEIPDQFAEQGDGPATIEGEIGTPMAERVATLGLLNKRNNLSQDVELKPGEQKRIGDVILRLSACERTAPWENPPETGAFVQIIVNQRIGTSQEREWQRVFSGWLFKNSPSLNVVESAVYDVWVKDCAMSFPGEETSLPQAAASPAPRAAAAPSPTPEPAAPSNET